MAKRNVTSYVAGFFFDMLLEKVWLILKNKPNWQRGHLNGIGGKIEEGETPEQAMNREFKEETGHQVYGAWKQFCVMTGDDWEVTFFYVVAQDIYEFGKPKTTTDEEITVVECENILYKKTISNIPWLLHMAIDDEMNGINYQVNHTYSKYAPLPK